MKANVDGVGQSQETVTWVVERGDRTNGVKSSDKGVGFVVGPRVMVDPTKIIFEKQKNEKKKKQRRVE